MQSDPVRLYNPNYAATGNEYELFHQKETGSLDFQWMREYGSTWRTRGYFGVCALTLLSVTIQLTSIPQADQIMTADPKVHNSHTVSASR